LRCRICLDNKLFNFFDVGKHPNGNSFVEKELIHSDKLFDVRFGVCFDCISVQLIDIPESSEIFLDHPYLTRSSKPYVDELKEFSNRVLKFASISDGSVLLDIGANDGTLLELFNSNVLIKIGVDPSKISRNSIFFQKNQLVNKFWGLEVSNEIKSHLGEVDVITSTASFYHMEDIHEWISGVDNLLSDSGIFAVQMVYLKSIIVNNSFDQFYHEHSFVHSITAIHSLLKNYNLEIKFVEENQVQGGSVFMVIGRRNSKVLIDDSVIRYLEIEKTSQLDKRAIYEEFMSTFQKRKLEFNSFLGSLKSAGKTVGCIGASLRGITLLNYFGVDSKQINFLLELNEYKINKFTSGSGIPVLIENLETQMPDYLIVLSWTFKNSIIEKYAKFLNEGGKMVFPSTRIEVV
jgi:hypothetical protein